MKKKSNEYIFAYPGPCWARLHFQKVQLTVLGIRENQSKEGHKAWNKTSPFHRENIRRGSETRSERLGC